MSSRAQAYYALTADARSTPLDRLNRLAAIVEFSEDAIVGKDMHGIITEWNKGAEQLYGYAADEVIGKPVSLPYATQPFR